MSDDMLDDCRCGHTKAAHIPRAECTVGQGCIGGCDCKRFRSAIDWRARALAAEAKVAEAEKDCGTLAESNTRLRGQFSRAVNELDAACAERDAALAKLAEVEKERDKAIVAQEAWFERRPELIRARDAALSRLAAAEKVVEAGRKGIRAFDIALAAYDAGKEKAKP